jgi:hypothetical protein
VLPTNLTQITWKSPVSSKILLEAGWIYQVGKLNPRLQFDPQGDPTTIAATESSTNFQIRAPQNFNTMMNKNGKLRFAASYITGAHAVKAGADFLRGIQEQVITRNGDYTVTLLNGSPRSMTLFAPVNFRDHLNADLGLYVQDQWTINRATLNYGLRYDYLNANVLPADVPANRWLPAHHYDGVSGVPLWHDVSPRVGVSYDLFGDSKTAVKAGIGRYVQGQAVAIANANNPQTTSVLSANRNWTDNGDFIPDCDFSDPALNKECGPLGNLSFGQNNPRATTYDPDVLHGFGKRGYNWETSAAVQRQIASGVSVNVGYFRRWYGNQTVTDNVLVTPDDFSPFCVTLPTDPRLPGGGQPLCGLYDVSPAKFGQTQNLVTFASKYGKPHEVFNGADVSLSARLKTGLQVSGGLSTGRTELDNCFVIDSPQALLDCDVKPPFLIQYKVLGVAPLPWYGIQTSLSFRSVPGPEISGTYTATNAEVLSTLKRNLASGLNGTVPVPVVPLGTFFAERTNEVNMRFSKIFRVGHARLLGSLDIQNIFNDAAPQALNLAYGGIWQQPTVILGPRFFKFAAQIDF